MYQNVEQTNTDTRTNQQYNIVEIESSFASDHDCIYVGGAVLEGTSDTDDEVDPTLWLSKKTFRSPFSEIESLVNCCVQNMPIY